MIILVTLMVAASRVLSIPIDDVPDSSYVAIDSSVPLRIDPATITRLYREQSSYPVSSPPFSEGFYYTVPARLLLYQPPPGQSYQAGRANAKDHGNCDNQYNPIAVGDTVQSSQRQTRSYDEARISADELPSGNFPGGAAQPANYYGQSSNHHHLSTPVAYGFSGSSGHLLDMRSYNYVSPNEVQGTSGNIQEQYSQIIPVSHGNSKHAISRVSQDYQNALVTQSVGHLNSRLQGSWPQSTGPTSDPADNYRMQPSQNLYEKYPSGPYPSAYGGPQFPLYEESNTKKYGESSYTGESSETVSRQEGTRVGSGFKYQTSTDSISGSQSHPMVNHRGYGSNSYNIPSPVAALKPQSSQISPSYLVGFKLLTKTPSLSTQGPAVWDLPNFPKHMVEPWASKMYQDGAHPASRYGFQSRPVESFRTAAPSPRFRPPPSGILPGTKAGTPWVVLMIPPDSLFRKDYNIGMKIPWLSLDNGKDLTFARAGTPPCQKENLNSRESQPSQSNVPLEIKHTLANEPQQPVSGSWESQPLAGRSSGLEETTEFGGVRSIVTLPSKSQFQNLQASSQVIQDQTIMKGRNIKPSTVTKYISSGTSGTQQLIEHTGEDRVTTTVSQNGAALAGDVHPRGEVQTIIEGVVINGTSMHLITSGSQQLADQSSMGGTESNRERLQAESMILASDSSSEMINYVDAGNTGTKQMIEGSDAALSGTTLIEGARVASELKSISSSGISSASNLDRSMTVGGENLEQKMENADELVHSTRLLEASLGSNDVGRVGTGMTEQVRVSEGNMVFEGDGSSTTFSYAQSGDPAIQRIIQQGIGQVSTTALAGGAPSSSKMVRYTISEGGVQDNLGEADLASRNGGSSTVAHYINSGSTSGQHIIEQGPETIKTQIEEGGSISEVIRDVTEGVSGQEFMDQANALATYFNGAPSTSKPIRNVTSRGVEGENLGESKIVLRNGESSTVMRDITSGSTGTQQVVEEGLAPQTISTLVQEGNSGSQVIRYLTESSNGTTSQLVGIPSGSEGHSEVVQYNLTGYTESHQVIEQGNGLESTTTILGGTPSTSKTIHYVTTGGAVEKNFGEKKISIEKDGPSIVTRYTTSDSTGTQTRVEQSDTIHPSSTSNILDGAPMTGTINYGTTEEEVHRSITESTIARENVGTSPVTQVSEPIAGQLIEKSSSSQTEVTQVDAVPSSLQAIRYGTESQGYNAFEDEESNSTPYNINTGEHQVEEPANSVASTSTLEDSANSSSEVIRYTVGGGKQGSEVEFGPNTSTQYTISGGTGAVSKVTTTIVEGAPMTTKVIRYIITADGQRQEIVDESNPTLENKGLPSVTDTNPAEAGVMGVAPNSTKTFVKGAVTTNKIMRYITTPDGQRQEIVDESSLAHENGVLSSVTNTNPAGVMGVGPMSTVTFVKGAPTTTKVIRYIITADGQRQEIVDESNPTLENEGLSSVTDTNPAGVMGVVPKSTKPFVKGAPTATKVIRYIITADGQRQEIVDESNPTLENEGLSSVTDTNPAGVMGVGPMSTATFVEGAPTTTKVIRYIITADGQRQEIVDESNPTLENEGLSSVTDTNPGEAGFMGVVPMSSATFVKGAPTTTKVIRYIITADGQRQEIVDESSLALENAASEGPASAAGTGQFVNVGNEFQSSGNLENGQSGSQTIHYRTSGGMEQQLGQPTASGIDGQSSVTSFFRTGRAGAQEIIDQDTSSDSITTVVGGAPATYKTMRYMSNDGSESQQQMVGTSSTNQPSKTITLYVNGANDDSSGQPHLQQGGSTVTHYVSSGGPSSQSMSGPGNRQSKTIVAGSPSTFTRYSVNYPQQSGSSGMRYMQNFQPRQTSTIMKPASYASGAQSSRSYVMSPPSTVVKKSY